LRSTAKNHGFFISLKNHEVRKSWNGWFHAARLLWLSPAG
jgi:hypothetical protein